MDHAWPPDDVHICQWELHVNSIARFDPKKYFKKMNYRNYNIQPLSILSFCLIFRFNLSNQEHYCQPVLRNLEMKDFWKYV